MKIGDKAPAWNVSNLHFGCLLLGEAYVRQMVSDLGLGIAVMAVLAVCFGVSAICHRSRSEFL